MFLTHNGMFGALIHHERETLASLQGKHVFYVQSPSSVLIMLRQIGQRSQIHYCMFNYVKFKKIQKDFLDCDIYKMILEK